MAAVVNQTFARTFFPNEDPIGKRVTVWYGHATIVGVVPDFKINLLDRKPYPEIFWSWRQATSANVSIMARTKPDPALLSTTLRQKIQEFDPDLQMHSMGEVITGSLARACFGGSHRLGGGAGGDSGRDGNLQRDGVLGGHAHEASWNSPGSGR